MKADRPLPDCVWCPQDRKVLSGLNPLRLLSPPPSSLQLWQCWGSLSHAPGGWECCHGCREFVVLCDIQVHRIIAKHHLFYWVFSFPSGVTLQHSLHGYIIHYDSLGKVHLRSVQDSDGPTLHLLAMSTAGCYPAYIMWLRTVLIYIHCVILYLLQNYYTEKFRSLCLYSGVSNDPLYMTYKGTNYLAKDMKTFLQGGFPQFFSGNFG